MVITLGLRVNTFYNTAKSILEQDVDDLVRRTDLEEETIQDVMRILREEFE